MDNRQLTYGVQLVYKRNNLYQIKFYSRQTWLKMVSKWRLMGLDDYVVGEDNKIYKLPFISNKRFYNFREIKEQYPQRFRLNGSWYTKQLLREKLIKDSNPIEIYGNISDCVF